MAYGVQPDMMYQQQPNGAMAYEKNNPFSKNWTFGFFDCCTPFSTFCLGCWCPCILFGKTQAREKGEVNPSGWGAMCCAYYCLLHIGGHSCLQAVKRTEMRDKYRIPGNFCGDWLRACCCSCCALVQEDKEAVLRQTTATARSGEQYQAPQGMVYP